MLQLFKKKEIVLADGIIVQQSTIHGLGVFACKKFRSGESIEIAPVILMEQIDKEFLQTTTLFSYYFLVEDKKFPVALGLGYSSLYNHSYSANAIYSISLKDATIQISACKKVMPGDEITLNYNGRQDDVTPVYFVHENYSDD
jgi:hypothetical protein